MKDTIDRKNPIPNSTKPVLDRKPLYERKFLKDREPVIFNALSEELVVLLKKERLDLMGLPHLIFEGNPMIQERDHKIPAIFRDDEFPS